MPTKKASSKKAKPLAKHPRRASHDARLEFDGSKFPILCRLRCVPGMQSLRHDYIFDAIRDATKTAQDLQKIFICHLSIQHDRILMVVEADNEAKLARGMQGFSIAAARGINAAISKATGKKRSGPVWADRYHARVLRTPAETRDAIAHVLNSWRRSGRGSSRQQIDPLSSAHYFNGWKDRSIYGKSFHKEDDGWEPLWIMVPRTRLLFFEWATDPRGNIAFDELPDVPELADVVVSS